MSQQMVEVGLAAVSEDLQAVAEALHTCQAAHAQAAVTASSSAATRAQTFLHMAQIQLSCQQKTLSGPKKSDTDCTTVQGDASNSPCGECSAEGEQDTRLSIGLGGHPAEYDCTILLNLTCPSELQGIPNLYNTVAERNVLFCIASLQKA
nr:uncharacterized protein LOC126517476 [Dermacentor andersoni]